MHIVQLTEAMAEKVLMLLSRRVSMLRGNGRRNKPGFGLETITNNTVNIQDQGINFQSFIGT